LQLWKNKINGIIVRIVCKLIIEGRRHVWYRNAGALGDRGPKKLPQIAKSLGKTLGELRKAADDLKDTISSEIDPIRDEIPDKRELEEALKKKFMDTEEKESKADKGSSD
jgi:Sec-independent protein translocase protein TatA